MKHPFRMRLIWHLLPKALLIVAATQPGLACSDFPPLRKVGSDFTVRIMDHGDSIPSIKVQLTRDSDQKVIANLISDKDGLVKFSSVPQGAYTLSTKPGYLNWISVDVGQGDKAQSPIEIEWPNLPRFEVSVVSGQFRTGLLPEVSQKSEAIHDVRVRLVDPVTQHEIAETRTDRSGMFHFDHVDNGRYFLHLGGREGTDPWDGDIYVVVKINSSQSKNMGVLYIAMTSCGLIASPERYKE